MSRLPHSLFEQSWPEGEYRLVQVGFLVDDVLAASAKWAEVHRVGPFHVLPPVEQNAIHRGEPATITLQVAVAQAGPVQIELIQQHCDRPSHFTDWSKGGSAAFHQMATVSPDYDGKKAHFEALGYELVTESLSGRFRVAYFDTAADFGFYTEVIEETPGFLRQLTAISQTCATWDGTDPVRILTRDGYRIP